MPERNSRLLVEAELRAFSRELDAAIGPLDLSSAVTRRLEASPVVHRRAGGGSGSLRRSRFGRSP